LAGEHVEPAVEVVIEEKEAELQQLLAGRPTPGLGGFIGKKKRIVLGGRRARSSRWRSCPMAMPSVS